MGIAQKKKNSIDFEITRLCGGVSVMICAIFKLRFGKQIQFHDIPSIA